MDKDLGYWGTVFDVEGLVDAGEVDALIGALRPDVIETIKQAIADWELDYANKRGCEGGTTQEVPSKTETDPS